MELEQIVEHMKEGLRNLHYDVASYIQRDWTPLQKANYYLYLDTEVKDRWPILYNVARHEYSLLEEDPKMAALKRHAIKTPLDMNNPEHMKWLSKLWSLLEISL